MNSKKKIPEALELLYNSELDLTSCKTAAEVMERKICLLRDKLGVQLGCHCFTRDSGATSAARSEIAMAMLLASLETEYLGGVGQSCLVMA